MKIAKITTQKNRQDRFNVFRVESGKEEYAFSIDENVLVQWQLQKGMTLTEEDITAIQAADQKRKVWNDALHYLTHSMRTEYQVIQYLKKKEYEEEAIEESIKKLTEYRLLQDEEYAMAFVRTKMNTSDKGPAVISEDLYQKGISKDLSEKALQQYTYDAQLETAQLFLRKNGKPKSNESSSSMKNRLLHALRRKGFSMEMALQAWENEQVEIPENEEIQAVFEQGEKAKKKWMKKYTGQSLRMKVKEFLYRKGFELSHIEHYLQYEMEVDEEDENEEKI
ncbi:regulatory protein [Salibacterium salarium]|uniref:recombination regulator RecX n=1 Tax=Salibacterium salarium TaxID=284579 RepID=UPI00278A95D2|nr:recombination regulator RecX [Salibacterium salarium]MDQ0300829.1 regulatory protein [Salibacterium salarium]